jgi:RNA polymerase sigma-70 factor (ECF subfamily)
MSRRSRRSTGTCCPAADRTLAEELTSETFLGAVNACRRSQAAPVRVAWLIGVARHKLADHWRRREREERGLRLVHESEPETTDPWDDQLRRRALGT